MLKRSNIYRFLFLITISLAAMQFSPSVSAQETIETARKFDEFEGTLGSCDLGARLDNFAIELQNRPETNGFIISYGPEGKGFGSELFIFDYIKDYLENSRGLNGTRIKTLYGGRYKELDKFFTELWIIPPYATLPEPLSYENNVKTFTGMFAEYEFWEGPSEGEGNVHGNVTLAGFADVLRQQPQSLAYVVVQNTKEGSVGAWRRAANDVVPSLENDYKVPAERIRVICAGFNAGSKDTYGQAIVQLWVLPKGASPPAVEVTEPEPTPTKAVEWRSFTAYDFADTANERRVFEGFADVLRSNKKLSVYIIVRQPRITQEDVEPDAEVEPGQNEENEEPDVDLMEVAENWKADLAKDSGISEQRFILVGTDVQESDINRMEIWIIPAGASLPDPNIENSLDANQASDDNAQEVTPEAEPLWRM